MDEMIGRKFGRLTVKERIGKKKSRNKYICQCTCGNTSTPRSDALLGGFTKSCGCLQKERVSAQVGNKNPHWRGGWYINDAGYIMIYSPGHHRASSNGYVREHIVLAEKALGKPLPEGVQVHHYGENGDNGKLVICQDVAYHSLIHIRTRAYKACGNANYRKCRFCQKYDDPKNMYIRQRESEGWIVYHRKCYKEYARNKRVNK